MEDIENRLRVAVNEFCSCGGAGPGEGCVACDIWHYVMTGTVAHGPITIGVGPLPDIEPHAEVILK